MRDYRPYVLSDKTEIPGHWYKSPERFVATEYGWRKLTAWAAQNIVWCQSGKVPRHFGGELHHQHGRGAGKRNDQFPEIVWLCRYCHERMPILRRGK
jgi:hypothetical protein